MRRQTISKSVVKPASRRERERHERHEDAVRPRPEVREDIHRTWWPDG